MAISLACTYLSIRYFCHWLSAIAPKRRPTAWRMEILALYTLPIGRIIYAAALVPHSTFPRYAGRICSSVCQGYQPHYNGPFSSDCGVGEGRTAFSKRICTRRVIHLQATWPASGTLIVNSCSYFGPNIPQSLCPGVAGLTSFVDL